jgi:tetratricopeptide (TPR) repeat protein
MDQFTNKNVGAGARQTYGGNMRRRPGTGGMQGSRQGVPQRRNGFDTARGSGDGRGTPQQSRQSDSGVKSEVTINILGKISAICVFMLFFGLPLFFLNLTYQGIGFEKQYYFYLWTFLGTVALIAQGMLGGKIEIRRTTLDIPLGVMWLAFLIATIFSVDRYHSVFGFFGNPVNGLISVTAAILAYYLIVSYISKERISLIWWAITLSGSIVVLWSFLATMRFVPLDVLRYISPSLTGSFTSLAVFLGMMLPVFIVSFSLVDNDAISGLKRRILSFALFVVTVLDVITLSVLHGYVQWYTILIAVGLLLVFTMSRLVKISQKANGMIIFVFLALFLLWFWGQPIITRTAIQPEASINYSLSFDIAKEAIKNNPLFGSGPGTYGYNFSLHRPKDLNRSGQYDIRFYSDRGAFMESISTVGLAGMISLVVVVLTYVSTAVHAFMRSQDDDVKMISLGLFISSVVALIYGMFWAVDGVIIIYGILIGALTIGLLRGSLSSDVDQKLSLTMASSPQHALSFAFLSILVAVGVIFGFVTLGKMFVADVHAGNALRARATGDFTRSSDLFRKAVVLNAQEGRYFTVISQYGLDLANVELAKPEEERNNDAVVQYVNGATGAAASGKELMPNDVLANETKGFVYENSGGFVSGAVPAALSAYERAGELEPFNPYLDIAVGRLKLVEAQAQGEGAEAEKNEIIEDAKTYFESAKEKTTFDYEGQSLSLFAPAHYYLSVVEEALGNTDEAIDAMTTALQVTQFNTGSQQQLLSRQINYGFNLARLLQVRGTDEDMKNAENLLQQIIGVNDQEVNSHLSLGLLYERQGKRDEAVSEYKKILEIIPQEDEKARENIQNLVDTVEQGGSNIDTSQNDTVPEAEETVEAGPEIEEEEEVSMIIVKRGDAGDRADRGRDVLAGEGYDADIRNEDDAEYDGVMVFYGDDADDADVQAIERTLSSQFNAVNSEQNNAEVNTYNHDIVVVIGRE